MTCPLFRGNYRECGKNRRNSMGRYLLILSRAGHFIWGVGEVIGPRMGIQPFDIYLDGGEVHITTPGCGMGIPSTAVYHAVQFLRVRDDTYGTSHPNKQRRLDRITPHGANSPILGRSLFPGLAATVGDVCFCLFCCFAVLLLLTSSVSPVSPVSNPFCFPPTMDGQPATLLSIVPLLRLREWVDRQWTSDISFLQEKNGAYHMYACTQCRVHVSLPPSD